MLTVVDTLAILDSSVDASITTVVCRPQKAFLDKLRSNPCPSYSEPVCSCLYMHSTLRSVSSLRVKVINRENLNVLFAKLLILFKSP